MKGILGHTLIKYYINDMCGQFLSKLQVKTCLPHAINRTTLIEQCYQLRKAILPSSAAPPGTA